MAAFCERPNFAERAADIGYVAPCQRRAARSVLPTRDAGEPMFRYPKRLGRRLVRLLAGKESQQRNDDEARG